MLQCGSLWGTGVNLWMFGNNYSFCSFILMNGVTVDVEIQETLFLFTFFVVCAQITARGIAYLLLTNIHSFVITDRSGGPEKISSYPCKSCCFSGWDEARDLLWSWCCIPETCSFCYLSKIYGNGESNWMRESRQNILSLGKDKILISWKNVALRKRLAPSYSKY